MKDLNTMPLNELIDFMIEQDVKQRTIRVSGATIHIKILPKQNNKNNEENKHWFLRT